MRNRILFTCVGGSDPVRNLHDGAMLHIIRHYLPQKVYIVLTKEMEKYKKEDDRYNRAIQKFCQDFHHKIETRYFSCGIADPSDYDAFNEPFQKYFKQIIRDNPDSELLVNISSGTPQMKMAMCLLSLDTRYRNIKLIQVKTPDRKSNTSDTTTNKHYDVLAEIELNEDNKENSVNRCSVPELFELQKAFNNKQLQILLENYEYHSALLLMQSYGMKETDPALALTEHLWMRQDLKTEESKKLVDKINFGFKLFPVENIKCREETEFFLILQNLSKTGKITEFTIRLNPFVIRMQELYLKKKFKFDCQRLKVTKKIYDGKTVEYLISSSKIQCLNPDLWKTINENFRNGYEDTFPNIKLYNIILEKELLDLDSMDNEKRRYIEFFKSCEKINEERNASAHNLYGMNETDLKSISGMTSSDILKRLKTILITCYGKECPEEIFSIYDKANKKIVDLLT